MAELVIAVEQDEVFASEAEEILSEVGADNVVVQVNKLEDGAPKHGPYDVIILQGGVEEIPLSILNQLKNGGRIGAIFIEEGLGTARIGYKLNNKVTWRYSFNAAVPILDGFRKQKDFVL
jgi:protein-L-isoaspartate(D-aspartate) O-methyltransferase